METARSLRWARAPARRGLPSSFSRISASELGLSRSLDMAGILACFRPGHPSNLGRGHHIRPRSGTS
jgi:hypothetical protein